MADLISVPATLSLAIAQFFGLDNDTIQHQLNNVKPSPHRLSIHKLSNAITLIDDSYNSNPIAVQFSVESVLNDYTDRTIIVLGDMGELGDNSDQLHRDTLHWVRSKTIDPIITYGTLFSTSECNFNDINCLFDYLKTIIKEHDVILVKGSRSTQLDTAVQRLIDYFSCQIIV